MKVLLKDEELKEVSEISILKNTRHTDVWFKVEDIGYISSNELKEESFINELLHDIESLCNKYKEKGFRFNLDITLKCDK